VRVGCGGDVLFIQRIFRARRSRIRREVAVAGAVSVAVAGK
jgi:hypothetical protein